MMSYVKCLNRYCLFQIEPEQPIELNQTLKFDIEREKIQRAEKSFIFVFQETWTHLSNPEKNNVSIIFSQNKWILIEKG